MNPFERFVYDLVKQNPRIKMGLRDLYQNIFDLVPGKSDWSKNRVTARNGFFYGFHDHTPFSSDNKNLLAHQFEIPLRMPKSDDLLSIGIFRGKNWENFSELTETKAWNWHQGAKLQWRGNTNQFIYNDHRADRNISILFDVDKMKKTELPDPISSVSGCGKFAVGYSFARVEKYMPGYGYVHNTNEKDIDKDISDNSTINLLDLQKQTRNDLISVKSLAGMQRVPSMDGASHFISHALFSPDNHRFVFLHRWTKGDIRNRYSRMITMDVHGNSLHIFPTDNMVSHLCWINSSEILAYCRADGRDGYFLFKDQTDQFRQVGKDIFKSDGHPTYLPGKSKILTDTYPDRSRRSSLLLYDENSNKLEVLGRFKHPKKYSSANPYKNWRCDLHPRADRNGNYACFDSVHTGTRSLCTMKI